MMPLFRCHHAAIDISYFMLTPRHATLFTLDADADIHGLRAFSCRHADIFAINLYIQTACVRLGRVIGCRRCQQGMALCALRAC